MILKLSDVGGDKFIFGVFEFFVVDFGMSVLFLGFNGDKVIFIIVEWFVFVI